MRNDRRTRLDFRSSDGIWNLNDRFAAADVNVYEAEAGHTGLLDAHGTPLVRERPPVGFLPRRDT